MSTPVQRQYHELKKKNPEAILFFRLGDFYEMFFEDAKLCSRILGIQLTARHRGTENEMPMCGFPHHASTEYLEKLIAQNYKVAIAEQVKDPKTKVIHREIARVVTPGTTIENGNLVAEKNNFLAAVARDGQTKNYAIAHVDVSTGEFRTAIFEDEISFFDEIYKLNPTEILIDSQNYDNEDFCKKLPKVHLTPRPDLNKKNATNILQNHFQITDLDIFGFEKIEVLIAVSAMALDYLKETQKTNLNYISKIVRYSTDDLMRLDATTFRHLEVFSPIFAEEVEATFLSVFEKPITAIGGRVLRYWLANPLLNVEKINFRGDGVTEIFQDTEILDNLNFILKNISDLERALSRLAQNRGSARDAALLKSSFEVFPKLKSVLEKCETPILKEKHNVFSGFDGILEILEKSLIETPPPEITSGGMFRDEFDEKLDGFRTIARDSKKWCNQFLKEKIAESGIKNLRIKFSKNFGFCLEASKSAAMNAPESWIRRQTLVNAERFSTPELADFESKFLSAETNAFAREYELFLNLREKIMELTAEIQNAARAIGEIDALRVFAKTARKWRWTRPKISKDSKKFSIKEGRHPVIEKISPEIFIANDCQMDSESSLIHLITGPNMAGKSTFLRQNALIILAGQIGSFVPAKSAEFGVFDRIFTRVGASDNLAGGKSTFFVEMTETAKILHAATEKSFVILDEIGRGTSTFDGISLAWAITEFLHNTTKSKVLFATHFHELIDLAESLEKAENWHVSVSQNNQGIVFLRKILSGGISDSFGIEVAKLAGVPNKVIEKSREILARLESENLLSGKPNLFSSIKTKERIIETKKESPVEKFLEKIDPNEVSPKEALELLFECKRQINRTLT
jgi:DNA mismatch repair protein MutS